jgi:hypothetical protein
MPVSILAISVASVALVTVCSLVLILLLRQRSTPVQPVHRPAPTAAERHTSQHMLCPKCHTMMRSGFTNAERGIAWCDGNKKIPGRMSLAWYKGILPNTLNHGLSLKLNTAWRCDQCSSVLIDFSSLSKPPEEKK